jgi:hypothetical protein
MLSLPIAMHRVGRAADIAKKKVRHAQSICVQDAGDDVNNFYYLWRVSTTNQEFVTSTGILVRSAWMHGA